MASNAFGNLFRITTFGETHGPGIGVVVDGCPAGIFIDTSMIEKDMERRRPGYSDLTSPRKEPDIVEILSGVLDGVSTGAPIALWITNRDVDSSKYLKLNRIYRPGHAQYSYDQKYGICDYRGGGRASARETVARVAAGSVAKMLLPEVVYQTEVVQVGKETDPSLFAELIETVKQEGDSIGAIISCTIRNVPAGLGEPIYEKLEANLAKAMLSINASRGIEFGEGFASALMKGSEHNDEMVQIGDDASFVSNHHGGIIAGISTGEPIFFRVVFKPASSIQKYQRTVDSEGKEQVFTLPKGSRHDPCVALRALPIVENMAALVLADAYLMNRCSKISLQLT